MRAGKASLPQGDESSKSVSLPSYPDWLVRTHAQTITYWGWLFVLVMVASSLHPIGSLLPYRLFSLGFGIAAARIAMAAKQDPQLVRRWIACFSGLQLGVLCMMGCIGRAPAVHSYMDWATSLTTIVPQLLILDLQASQLAFFVLAYVMAEAAYYYGVVGHSIPLAVLRRAVQAYMRQGGVLGAAPQQEPAEPVPQKDDSMSKADACEQLSSTLLHVAADRDAQAQQPAEASVPAPAPGAFFRAPYHSRMRHYNVVLTLETPEMANNLSEEALASLTRALSQNLGDERMCYMAVRSGCIVVSLDLWELAAADAGLNRHHPGSAKLGNVELGRVLENIAREWVEEQGLRFKERQEERQQQRLQQQQQEVHVQVSELNFCAPATEHQPLLGDSTNSSSPAPHTCGCTPLSLSVPSVAITLPPPTHPSPPCSSGHPPPPNVAQGSTVTPNSCDFQAARTAGAQQDVCSLGAQPPPLIDPPTQPTQQICLPVIIRRSADSSSACSLGADMTTDLSDLSDLGQAAKQGAMPDLGPDLGAACVLGWHGSEQCSPEEDGPGKLRMLATLRGRFLPLQVVSVAEVGRDMLIAQVSISLPAAAAASSTGLLALELWAAGRLAAGHSTLLLPHAHARIADELQAWAASLPEQQQHAQHAQQAQQAQQEVQQQLVSVQSEEAPQPWQPQQEQQQQSDVQLGTQQQQQQQEQQHTTPSCQPHPVMSLSPALDAGLEERGLFAFAGDLYVWMHLHASLLQQVHDGQQQREQEGRGVREEESVAVAWQRELLCNVGKDLLMCSVGQGMTGLAELLLHSLQSPPLGLSFSSDICPREPQLSSGLSPQHLHQQYLYQQQQQQQEDALDGAHSRSQQQQQQQQQQLSSMQLDAPQQLQQLLQQGEPSGLRQRTQQQQQQQQQQLSGMQLDLQQLSRATSAADRCRCLNCAPFPTWLLGRYKHVVGLWSRIIMLMTLAHLVHPAVACKPYKVLVVAMMVLAVGSTLSLRWDAFRLAYFCVAGLALLQVAVAHHMSREAENPPAVIHLDLIFCLATYMPYMFVLQLKPAALAAYVAVNLVVQQGFNSRLVHVGSDWLPFLRAALCQGCVVCTHLVLTHKAYAEYMLQRRRKAQ